MTKYPKTISQDAMAFEAENYMIDNSINELIVINDVGELVGVVQIYDVGRV
jgi:CBS domain-containing protein